MRVRRVLLAVHALLILLGPAYFGLSIAVHDGPDANLGPAFAVLWLITLGSPWGWAVIHADASPLSMLAAATGAALVNLGIHALLWRVLRRQKRQLS